MWRSSRETQPPADGPSMGLCCWVNLYTINDEPLPSWLHQAMRDNGMSAGPICQECRRNGPKWKRETG